MQDMRSGAGVASRIRGTVLWIVVVVAGTSGLAGARSSNIRLVEEIDAARIRRHVAVLSSDAFEGRLPGTRGGELAAAYIENQLREAGIVPFGDRGTYRQRVPLQGSLALDESRLELLALGERTPLALGDDYLLVTSGAQTFLPRPVPLVFVGYGIVAPEFDYNDYQDVDVQGKVAVFLPGEPPSENPDYFAGTSSTVYASAETKQRIALARGAVGSVIIPALQGETARAWQRLRVQLGREELNLPYTLPRHLTIILHPNRVPGLFAEALYDFEQLETMARHHTLRSFHLPVALSFEGRFETRHAVAPNVIGIIQGSDPKLRDTYVVVSAHYDHLGVASDGEDRIYNGAVDNAMGVAGVLEIARVLSESRDPPKRSTIVLLTTAEESGLLGARYFLDHAPVRLGRMVANVNIDGMAFFAPFRDLFAVGGELSDLEERLQGAVKPLGLQVSTPPPEVSSRRAFSRSDQIAFAERGIPSVLINEGFQWKGYTQQTAMVATMRWMSDIYHTPQDEFREDLNFDATALHCRAALALVLQVAGSKKIPKWKPGVAYEYERLLSLARGN